MSQRSQVSGEAERNLVERNPWISLQTYLYICEVVWQMGSSTLITSYIWLHHPAYSAPPPLAKLWSHTFYQSHPINCWALRCLLLIRTHFSTTISCTDSFQVVSRIWNTFSFVSSKEMMMTPLLSNICWRQIRVTDMVYWSWWRSLVLITMKSELSKGSNLGQIRWCSIIQSKSLLMRNVIISIWNYCDKIEFVDQLNWGPIEWWCWVFQALCIFVHILHLTDGNVIFHILEAPAFMRDINDFRSYIKREFSLLSFLHISHISLVLSHSRHLL